MSHSVYSMGSEASDLNDDNAYCVFLNVVEGVGFNLKDNIGDFTRDKIILNATLNNIKFEIEGQSLSKESATIFNNCCIWETEMDVIKRMKTDNRPVKIECFLRPGNNNLSGSKSIGTLLLPIRGLTPINALRNVQIKVQWHKLGTLSAEWRKTKPEICLLLMIVKKHIVESGQLESLLGKGKKSDQSNLFADSQTETGFMLHSQSNVYVQLLEHIGAIQIGNNPDLDCDFFNVTLTFKQVRNIEKLFALESEGGSSNQHQHSDVFMFSYDILGKPSSLEILINRFDCYAINEKITFSFKTSLPSLRSYFQRIFYLPINLYYRGIAVASYRMDFNKLLPDELVFEMGKSYTKAGTFFFDRLLKLLTARTPKPSVSYTFSIQQMTFNAKHNQNMRANSRTFVPYKSTDIPAIDLEKLKQTGSIGATTARSVADKTDPITVLGQSSAVGSSCLSATDRHKGNIGEEIVTERRASSLPANSPHTRNNSSCNSAIEPNVAHSEDQGNALNVAEDVQPEPSVTAENDKRAKTQQQEESQNRQQPQQRQEQQLRQETQKQEAQQQQEPQQNQQSLQNTYPQNNQNPEQVVQLQQQPEQRQKPATDEKLVEAETETIIFNIVQELEDWKACEMQNFMQALRRKEQLHLASLRQTIEQERAVLHARLEAKIAKCDELNARLEKAHSELQINALKNKENFNLAEKVKQEIELTNATKFQMLEQQIEHLKVEVMQKDAIFDIKYKEMQFENKKLQNEKTDLTKRLTDMDKQICELRDAQRETEDLKKVIAQLREQARELQETEKMKNFYKQKWAKSEKELQQMKLDMMEQHEKLQLQRNEKENEFDCNKCLEEILSEEKDALDSDRSALRNIKEALLTASSSNPSSDDSVYEDE